MSIQFLLALQLISDIVLFVAVIFLLAIVGRNSWKKNSSPPTPPTPVDKETVAELERLISESQAATAHLIKAMDESRRALREAVCEVEEKESRRVERDAGVKKAEASALLPAVAQRRPAADAVRAQTGVSGKGRQDVPAKAPEKGQGNGQAKEPGAAKSGSADSGASGDYQAVIEMARKGMSEKEIIEQSELTEAEISLVLELGRKRNEFN